MLWKEAEYSGWGRVLKARARLARPERASDFAQVLAGGMAPAIGNLRSYGDAALNDQGKVVVMTRMDRFIGFDPVTGMLEAEAGTTIAAILQTFVPQGWMPAVVPGTAFATLGGCIANDVHGKNHHRDGTFGAHVDSLNLIGADGVETEISARRQPDLFRATLGGLGQTGIIRSARIRMVPCPSGQVEVHEERIDNLARFIDAFEGSAAAWNVGWIDATATGESLGRGIFEEGQFYTGRKRLTGGGAARSVPFSAPGFLMAPPIVRWFNKVRFGSVPVKGRNRLRRLEDFFFPLDGVRNWNRLYGKKGFHQFQCVVPQVNAAVTLKLMMGRIAGSRLASPIAVLKKLGPGRAGDLSFPMQGYTLAVDFAENKKARALIAELEAMTLEAGGRIYLAKDSLADPANVAAMYPELGEWQKLVNRIDPEGLFETGLVRRLNLRGRE